MDYRRQNHAVYYVYILLRSNQTTYIGRTADLKVYNNKRDSISREMYLKTGDGRHILQKQLKHTLQGPIV